MKPVSSLLSLLLAVLAVGCMPTVPEGGVRLAARPGRGPTGLVVRLPGSASECQRQILGVVEVTAPADDQADMVAVLRHEAAKLGGDRVVDLEYRRTGEQAHLSGMAAKCSDLFRGRDYLELASVSVKAPAGQPEVAYAALVEEAKRRGAKVVVDVDYERDQDGAGFRITGRLARYMARGRGGQYGYDVPVPAPASGPVTTWSGPKKRPEPGPRIECPPASTDPNGGSKVPSLDQCRIRF